MDYSYILIDGPVAWIVLIYLTLQLIAFCIIGNAWLKSQRKCDAKDKQLKKYRSDYNRLLGQYQRDTFKLPEADDV